MIEVNQSLSEQAQILDPRLNVILCQFVKPKVTQNKYQRPFNINMGMVGSAFKPAVTNSDTKALTKEQIGIVNINK